MCLFIIFSSTICYADDASPFAIYLSTEKSIVATEDIDKIKLSDKPIITMDDVISCSKRGHLLELSPEAYNRFIAAGTGTIFVVCVGNERIYVGAIMSQILSSTWGGVVVLKPVYFVSADTSESIKFELGYPSEKYFLDIDIRSDPRIIRAFKKADKLSNISIIYLVLYIGVAAIVVRQVAHYASKMIRANSYHRRGTGG